MPARLNPYIGFVDTARQALEFYQEVFGGELTLNTYGEFGAADGPDAGKVMHGQLETPDEFTLMASDAPSGMPHDSGSAVSISIFGDDVALRGYFAQLADGGTVTMPLEKQVWGDEFGMCTDRFGVAWMVNVSEPAG